MKNLFYRHFSTKSDRQALYATLSALLNGLIGFGTLIMGLFQWQPWLIINSIYYILLFGTRVHAIKQYSDSRVRDLSEAEEFDIEYNVYHRTGAFIMFLGLVYIIANLWLLFYGHRSSAGYWPMLFTATVAFVKMGISIRGVIVNRHFKNPIITTIKRISIVDASVSIVITQRTILSFEKSTESITSSALFGSVVGVVFILMGLYMYLQKKRNITWHDEEEIDTKNV